MKNPNQFTKIILNETHFEFHIDEFNTIEYNLFYNSFKQYYNHDKNNIITKNIKYVGPSVILESNNFKYTVFDEFLEMFKDQCLDYENSKMLMEKLKCLN